MPVRPDLARPTPPAADMFAAARQGIAELGHECDIDAPVTQVLCWGGSPAFAAGDGCLQVLAVDGGNCCNGDAAAGRGGLKLSLREQIGTQHPNSSTADAADIFAHRRGALCRSFPVPGRV